MFLAALVCSLPTADDTILCLSEIATNAILHSDSRCPGGTFTVHASLHQRRLRVEVQDQGGPWQGCVNPDGEHGRGLLVVSRTADAWGITGDGKTSRSVWFRLDLP